MEKVVRKERLSEFNEVRANLEYWLSKPPEERLAAIEELRRRAHGTEIRLERVARVVKRASR